MGTVRSAALGLVLAAAWVAISAGPAAGQKKQRDVISREEIDNSPKKDGDILAVIRSLRPHFLEPPRGVRRMGMSGSDAGATVVFIEQNKAGGIDALQSLQADQVAEVRYLDPSKAEAEYGLAQGSGGAIVIKLVKRSKPPAE